MHLQIYYKQSLDIKFRLVFFDLRSCVRYTISHLSDIQYGSNLVPFSFEPRIILNIKNVPNPYAEGQEMESVTEH